MNRSREQIVETSNINWITVFSVISLCFFLFFFLFSPPAPAGNIESQKQISDAIHQYMNYRLSTRYKKFDIHIQPIDSRLKFSECDQIQLQHRPRNRITGRLTMKVSCTSPSPWRIHVAFQASAFDDVIVATHPIAMGSKLQKSDIKSETRDISLLHRGYFNSIEQISGYVAKRPISSDQIISPNMVNPALMISRGEVVVIQAQGQGLNIRTTGISMDNGAYGELIRVKNSKTNKQVEGRITAPGQIKVSL